MAIAPLIPALIVAGIFGSGFALFQADDVLEEGTKLTRTLIIGTVLIGGVYLLVTKKVKLPKFRK